VTDTVIIVEPDIRIVEAGMQGPPGPPGSGGAQTIEIVAAHTISGHRVVVATPAGAVYAHPDDPTHADAVLGITIGAAVAGDTATVLCAGEIIEPSWAWTPGQALFCTANGHLSTTPPSSGWSQIVAVAVASTRILLTGRQAVYR